MAPEAQNRGRTWTLMCVSSSDLNDGAGSSDSALSDPVTTTETDSPDLPTYLFSKGGV